MERLWCRQWHEDTPVSPPPQCIWGVLVAPMLLRRDITARGCQRQHMASVGSQCAAVVHPLPAGPGSPNRFSIYQAASAKYEAECTTSETHRGGALDGP